MLAAKSSVGVTPEVNLRNPLCTGNEHASKEIHPGFETQGRSHLKPKTWVSVAAQKELMSSKYFFKKIFKNSSVTDLPDQTALLIAIRSMVWPCLVQNQPDSPHPTVPLQVLYQSLSYLFVVAFSSGKIVIYKLLESSDLNQEGLSRNAMILMSLPTYIFFLVKYFCLKYQQKCMTIEIFQNSRS